MYFYRIAVVTKNEEIADFFRLEMELLHIGVDVLDLAESLDGRYLFVVVDTDTCTLPTESQYNIVALSEGNTTHISHDVCQLGWPLLLSAVQGLLGVMLSDGNLPSVHTAVPESGTVAVLHDSSNEAELDGRRVRLTCHEYAILCELCRSTGKTVRRERIMELLGATSGNISDVYICRLRAKLEADTGRRLIFTERGKGYYTTLHRK